MIKLLLAGGPFMFGTLVTSLVIIAIAIRQAVYLFGKSRRGRMLNEQVMALIQDNKVAQALRQVSADTTPLGKLLHAALMRADRPEKEIRRAVESIALEEIPRVKGGTVFLPQLSNLATLIGLIGTIHGLIIAFQGAGAENAAMRQEVLSQGIAIAFYNTFFGLTVATIGIVVYLALLGSTNGLLAMMERVSVTVIDTILWSREHGRDRAAGGGRR